jgi:hypothetical protein
VDSIFDFKPEISLPKKEIMSEFVGHELQPDKIIKERETLAPEINSEGWTVESAAKAKSDLIASIDAEIAKILGQKNEIIEKLGDFKITVPDTQPAVQLAITRLDSRNRVEYMADGSVDYYDPDTVIKNSNVIDITLLELALSIIYSGSVASW